MRPTRWRATALARKLGNDRDDATATFVAKLDSARRKSEKGVVVSTSDVGAGVKVGAALANDDFTGLHHLSSEALNAEVLGVGVPAVTSGRCALLVCHVV